MVIERTLAKFFRTVELQAVFSTPCRGLCMAALLANEPNPAIDHLTRWGLLPKTLASRKRTRLRPQDFQGE